MRKINIKLFFILTALFMLDIIKPLGNSLTVEFVFLGIVFISLDNDTLQSFIFCIFFGFLKDFFIAKSPHFSFIEFPLICLLVRYLLFYFVFVSQQTYVFIVRGLIPALAILTHIIFNSIYAGAFFPLFSLTFFIQSFLVFFLMMNLLKKWVRINLPRAIS